jgi:anti-sigma B factor antagonist
MTEVQAGSGGSRARSVNRAMTLTARAFGLGMLDGVRQEALVMDGALTITVRSERGVVIAAVAGEIDISTVAQLRKRLFELADNGGTLIIDLNQVAFIDSAGLGALVGTARRAAEHGGSLHAVCSQQQPRRLLWMTGVDRRIPLATTVDEVLMSQAASRDDSGSGP